MLYLYDKDHRYTPEATLLDNNVFNSLIIIFNNYVNMGYSPREIAHVMIASINDMELCEVLGPHREISKAE